MSNMGVEISSISNTIENYKTSQLKVNEFKMKRKVSAARHTKCTDTSNLSMKSKLRSFKREFGSRSGAQIPLRNLPSTRTNDAPQIRRLSRERWSRMRSNSDRSRNSGHSFTALFKVNSDKTPKPYLYKSVRYGKIIRSADKLPEIIDLNFGKIR